jgi:hypothetical protein
MPTEREDVLALARRRLQSVVTAHGDDVALTKASEVHGSLR